MPRISQWFIGTAVIYVIIGMIGGIIMGAQQDFSLAPAHAHLNLIGWVSLALMGFYYNANRDKAESRLATIQFWVSTIGLWIMIPGLVLTLRMVPAGEPIVITGSIITLLGMVLFAVAVFRAAPSRA
jgi:drug/metabolite transporter (DMT)-like permease